MSDTPKPSQEASEAWQGITRYEHDYWGDGFYYEAKEVEHARAADAQQIAALRAENADMAVQLMHGPTWMALKQRAEAAEAQLTALQAEQERPK